MKSDEAKLIEMERRFWQSMVDQQTDAALGLLAPTSFMVSPLGAMKFDHADYRRMAEHGSMVIKRFDLGKIDVCFLGENAAILSYAVTQVIASRGKRGETEQRMSDTSTWIRIDGEWRCAMHTETPMAHQ